METNERMIEAGKKRRKAVRMDGWMDPWNEGMKERMGWDKKKIMEN